MSDEDHHAALGSLWAFSIQKRSPTQGPQGTPDATPTHCAPAPALHIECQLVGALGWLVVGTESAACWADRRSYLRHCRTARTCFRGPNTTSAQFFRRATTGPWDKQKPAPVSGKILHCSCQLPSTSNDNIATLDRRLLTGAAESQSSGNYFIGGTPNQSFSFEPAYLKLSNQAINRASDMDYYGRLPFAGPIILGVAQQAEVHPRITRVLMTLHPRFWSLAWANRRNRPHCLLSINRQLTHNPRRGSVLRLRVIWPVHAS